MRLRRRPPTPAPEWGRRKLLGVLLAAAAALIAAVVGLGLAVYYSFADPHPNAATSTGTPGSMVDPHTEQAEHRSSSGESAARPGPLSTRRLPEIALPTATSLGPVGVSTGFPRTPEGALAQLAAIDQRTLQSASVATAQDVIGAWAVPGGPTGDSWSGVRAVAALLGSAGVTSGGTGSGSSGFLVSATPEMGLVRTPVGPDDAVVCVDFVVTATLSRTASIAVADCQRMVWEAGRWMVGPGPEPTQAPSVWPGTEPAFDAGFRVLRHE